MHSIAPEEEQLRHQYILAAEELESSSAEDSENQDDHRRTVCSQGEKGQQHPQLH